MRVPFLNHHLSLSGIITLSSFSPGVDFYIYISWNHPPCGVHRKCDNILRWAFQNCRNPVITLPAKKTTVGTCRNTWDKRWAHARVLTSACGWGAVSFVRNGRTDKKVLKIWTIKIWPLGWRTRPIFYIDFIIFRSYFPSLKCDDDPIWLFLRAVSAIHQEFEVLQNTGSGLEIVLHVPIHRNLIADEWESTSMHVNQNRWVLINSGRHAFHANLSWQHKGCSQRSPQSATSSYIPPFHMHLC